MRTIANITPATPISEVQSLLSVPVNGHATRPNGWHLWPNVQLAHQNEMYNLQSPNVTSFPSRGIVICGGGVFFASAYVTIKVLRHVGCKLPIQLWYFGSRNEREPWMTESLTNDNVLWIDADQVVKTQKVPPRILNGWELKAFAVRHCPYEHVLSLDADSYPITDPTPFFDSSEYQRHGAIFFPDFEIEDLHVWAERWNVPNPWPMFGLIPRQEPAFESGQFFVNRRRCWRELNLAWWLNDHSDYTYSLVYGDKETFHIAWRFCDSDYAMPSRRWEPDGPAMIQHGFDGERRFIHRCRSKWVLPSEDRSKLGFVTQQDQPPIDLKLEHEHFCLDQLRTLQTIKENNAV